mmetsp:Transcript_32339/g.64058  ORF Transcript_32339/g.64058 Transcript_32339/m.64058 type:complete len:721 (-) Transcript_32339:69-2231(-)
MASDTTNPLLSPLLFTEDSSDKGDLTHQFDIRLPAGKLGIIIAKNVGNKSGTIVVGFRESSPLLGKILPGSKLIALDGEDISNMTVLEINKFFSKKSEVDRTLTIDSFERLVLVDEEGRLENSSDDLLEPLLDSTEERQGATVDLMPPQDIDFLSPLKKQSGKEENSDQKTKSALNKLSPSLSLVDIPEDLASTEEGRVNDTESSEETQKTKFQKTIVTLCIVYTLPFTLIVSTQLPYLFFLIELKGTYEMDLRIGGLIQALSFVSRILTLYFMMWAPKTAVYTGSFLALVGYMTLVFTENVYFFLASIVIIQAAEISGALQIFVKDFYDDANEMGRNQRLQYSVKSFGFVFFWLVGGYLYEYFGMKGISIFGAVTLVFQITLMTVYVFLSQLIKSKQKSVKENAANAISRIQNEPIGNSTRKDCNTLRHIDGESDQEEKKRISHFRNASIFLNNYSKIEGIPITAISYIIAIAGASQALVNSLVFAIGSLLMHDIYGIPYYKIGIYSAAGSMAGTATAILVSNDKFVAWFKNLLPSPTNLQFASLLSTIFVAVTAIPNFNAYIVGFVCLNIATALSGPFFQELQAKITTRENYGKIAPMTLIVRRCVGLVSNFIGPAMYTISPQLPSIVGGVLSFVILVVMILGFNKRQKKNLEILTSQLGDDGVYRDGASVFVSKDKSFRNLKRLSFSEQIMMTDTLNNKKGFRKNARGSIFLPTSEL